MKKFIFKAILALLCGSIGNVFAQESEKERTEVNRYTVMERFEPQLMLSAKERIKLKDERRADIKKQRQVLDTIAISERKRQRLLQDLMKDPYSPRLSRTLAEIEFDEENEQ